MAGLELALLGPPILRLNGEEVTITERKVLALLIYLALEKGSRRRDTLATLFWPEHNQQRARSNLRYAFWLLRKTLGEEWFEIDQESAGLQPNAAIEVDATQYRAYLARWRTHCRGEEKVICTSCLADLRAGQELVRGSFLEGFTLKDGPEFDEWQFFQAESIRQDQVELLDALVQHHRANKQYGAAIECARRRIALDPLHEPAHRVLMDLYAQDGQQAAALRQYKECTRVLAEEFDTEPSDETENLYQAIRRRETVMDTETTACDGAATPGAERDTAGELSVQNKHTLEFRRHNLPRLLEAPIGRDAELEALEGQLIQSDVRLVTLTGPGGVGKTQLALYTAHRLLNNSWPYVFFVSLAALGRVESLASTLAQELRLLEAGGSEPAARVAAYLREKEALLVLDNFEHVLAAAPFVSYLLEKCPHLTVLATSRESLNLRWEHRFSVEPLEVERGETRPAMLAQSPAVQLFIRRAKMVYPALHPNDRDMIAIADICRVLGGLPLAIELAAARVELFPPQALSRRLAAAKGQFFRYLGQGPADAPARHRSLEVAFSWSYDLLDHGQQALFRMLAFFSGGASLEAVEEVGAAVGLAGFMDVLEGLFSLVEKSLVYSREQAGGEPCFWMLRPLQEYGLERAAEMAESERFRSAHARYFVELAERAESHLVGPRQVEWLTRLDEEIENLRSAMEWAVEGNEVAAGLRIAAALHQYWHDRHGLEEGKARIQTLLALAGSGCPQAVRAKALLVAGSLKGNIADAQARAYLDESIQLYETLGSKDGLCRAYMYLADAYFDRELTDHIHIFRQLLGQSITLAQECGDTAVLAHATRLLVEADYTALDYASARKRALESLTLYDKLQDTRGAFMVTFQLGRICFQQGEYAEARSHFQRYADQTQNFGLWRAVVLYFLGRTAYMEEMYAQAEEAFQRALAIGAELGDTEIIRGFTGYSYHFLGLIATATDRVVDAKSHLARALTDFQQSDYRPGMASALVGYAALAQALGKPALAVTLAAGARRIREEAMGRPLPPSEVFVVDRIVEPARQRLAPDEVDRAQEEGSGLGLSEAIALAETLM